MHKVGQAAHTPHGIGEIVEVDPGVRGGASYKVAGRGFSVWIDEHKLHVASPKGYRELGNDPGGYDPSGVYDEDKFGPHHFDDYRDDGSDDLGGGHGQDWRHGGLNDTIDPGLPYHVNKDNSTTLPYDYTPQHHVDIFQGEQTIQPGDYEIDPDERLHSSDSLTGEQRKDNRPYPGPNPDLFAKSAAEHDQKGHYDPSWRDDIDPTHSDWDSSQAGEEYWGEGQDAWGAKDHPKHHAAFEDTDPSRPEWGDDEWHEGLPDGPERTFDARMHEDPMHPQYGLGSPALAHPAQLEYDDPSDPNSVATLKRQEGTSYSPGVGRHHASLPGMEDHEIPGYLEHLRGKVRGQNISMGELSDLQNLAGAGHIHPDDMELHEAAGTPEEDFHRGQNRDWDNDAFDPREFGASYRPAGLSNRYAHILEADDHSEVGQFRADPLTYLQRHAHVMMAGDEDHLIEKFADYTNLLDSDEHLRTAAWKDVAAKAKRLRAEGAVHPQDIGPNRIMATVDGDNAQYKTLVLRGPGYAGIGKGANSATFSCTCQWGKWAFKRQYTFVGRMCSHALATLWELQSHSSKGNGGKFKSAGIAEDFKKWADDNNDGHIDQGTIQDFLNTQDEDFTREDVNKLYDYVSSHRQQAPERDYDIPYTLDNEKAYKTSEILRTRPKSMTPDLREVPKNDEHEWTDVTEDDRKTTGPDQIVHFQASITAALHRTADNFVNGEDTDQGGDVNPNPFKGITDFIDRHNVRAHPELAGPDTGNPFGSTPAQTTSDTGYHMDTNDLPAGGLGKGNQPGNLSVTDYLHPPAAGAGTAGTTKPTATPPPPAPVGGPSAPGNPAATPKAPSVDPAGTGTGLSTPNNPNGAPGAIGAGSTYHVNQGDTLSDIAQRAGLGKDNYQQIADANKDLIKDPNHIETGWDIKIPGQSGSPASPSTAAGGTSPIAPGSPADLKSDVSTAAGGTAPVAPGSPADPKAPDASTPPAGAPPVAADPAKNNPGLTNPALTPPTPGTNPMSPLGNPSDLLPKHSSRRRYAESSAAALLDKLRQKSTEPASDDLGHMDERNDEIRDLVDELQNEHGMDASFMVANLHYADSPADGDANFLGTSYPNWADEPFQGSGPDPRHYISDSQSYLDDHAPDLHDVTEGDDIIKFNDSRSKPQQGPRHTSAVKLHGGPRKAPRVDPGVRGRRSELQHSAGTMPENQDTNSLGGVDEPDPLATPDMAIEANYDGDGDLVANFQRSAAAADLMGGGSGGGGGMFSDDAIAANAQAMLRTAGRKFTPQEQRDLEEEAHILGARNLPTEDELAGTHYVLGF